MANQNIKCKYIFDDNYNPFYANGAHGGINPLGEIIIHFYLERTALPNSQTFTVADGKLCSELVEKVEPEDLQNSFVRFIQTGVVLNYPVAKEIHRWLGEHLKTLESVTNQQK